LTGSEDPRLHTLPQVTAALNTDLEGVTSELEQTHDELKDAYARIAQLEAEHEGSHRSSLTRSLSLRSHHPARGSVTALLPLPQVFWDRMPTFEL
jgi:uncharacterized protein YhaN